MRSLHRPKLKFETIFDSCVSTISQDLLKTNFINFKTNVLACGDDYISKAVQSEFYKITSDHSNNDSFVLGMLIKEDFKKLYTEQLVPSKKISRCYYDEILIGATNGKCPFCGFGQATTLDHYLPKNFYPVLSVLPENLVPSCRDCNAAKSTISPKSEDEQSLHPYFEKEKYFKEKWLYADVITVNQSIIFKYSVRPPNTWTHIEQKRVNVHFKHFNLAKRFSVEAAAEVKRLNYQLLNLQQEIATFNIKNYLERCFKKEYGNTWQDAMYEALYNSDWYCSNGFRIL